MKKFFLLPFIAIIILTGAIQSCENEPVQIQSSEIEDNMDKLPTSSLSSRTYVKMDDIPDVIGSLEKRMGSKASKSGGTLGNKIGTKDYEVYLDSIAQIVNEGSDTNYTFALDVKGVGPNEFYNLVVGKTPDGEIKDPIVVGYFLNQEDMDYFMNGGTDLKRLNANYRFYNFKRFFNSDLKLSATGNGDCGSGYIGGGNGGGPTVPPGGSITTSIYGATETTHFQTGNTSTVPYNYNISVTGPDGSVETSTGYASSLGLSSTFSTPYGQGPAQVSTYPPTTATINRTTYTTQDQNGTIDFGCPSSSHLDGAGWSLHGCEESGAGYGNKSGLTAMAGDCNIPEGTMATMTTFTLMILNKTSGYIGLNLADPVDWSRYIWLSHEVIPVCIPINQFVEGNGQSNDAKGFADLAQLALMNEGEVYWDDRVINTISFPCAFDVVETANQDDNPIGQKIKSSFGSEDSPDLFYSNEDIPQNNPDGRVLGRTIPTTDSQGNITSVKIELDNQFLIDATDLSIFATVIHENIHSLMYYQLSNAGITIDDPNIDYSGLANDWSKYVAHVQAGVPQDQILTDLAIMQHQIMGDIVSESAQIIQDYGNSKGYSVSDNTAEALAWAGLQTSVAWTLLDETIKENYKNIIDDESSGFEILAIGSPCN